MDEPAQRVLRVPEFADQPFVSFGLFDRVQVLPLDVLEDRDFQRLLIVEVADNDGYFVKPRLLGGAPAPLAGDDLKAIAALWTNHDRLDQPA